MVITKGHLWPLQVGVRCRGGRGTRLHCQAEGGAHGYTAGPRECLLTSLHQLQPLASLHTCHTQTLPPHSRDTVCSKPDSRSSHHNKH